jgi:hypothetical protein
MRAVSKPEKILAVMSDLSQAEPKALLYEDIVVAAFKRYPEDFQLRGYPEYPDSSDIHKPLYKMKRDGLVRSANKSFMLTPMGIAVARELTGAPETARDRLTKPEENEIKRITQSQAFLLFQEGQGSKILDTDFYDYLGVSVRTPKGDFLGRVATVAQAVEAHAAKRNDKLSKALATLHEWITVRFNEEILARK